MIKKVTQKHWDKLGKEKRIGTAIALFSLKSHKQKDYGIGDFGALSEFIELCNKYNLNVIQLLPINETSPHDNSPFGAISAFAINPLFIDIKGMKESESIDKSEEDICKILKIPNYTEHNVNYNIARTSKYKIAYYCYKHFRKNGAEERKKEFSFFKKANKWLNAYALFKVLKDENGWKAVHDWEKNLQIYSPDLYKQESQTRKDKIDFQKYIQWIVFNQFKNLHKKANNFKILIKGDIPLLVSNESADVWENPDFFDKSQKVGAPPDYYSAEGQDWGLPMYKWDVHRKEGFNWWKKRLNYAENFFDIYRIDHVLGLFRVWAIPKGKKATEGSFVPENQDLWQEQGEELLKMMLKSTSMLPIAEDLGMVPKIVRTTLDDLGIPGYKLMILEHKIPPQVFGKISLLATSTHDSPTLLGMWNNMSEQEKNSLIFSLSLPLKAEQYNEHIHHHLLNKLIDVPAHFVIFPLQDILGYIPGIIGDNPDNDRVNTPGTIGEHNWSYRLPDLNDEKILTKLNRFQSITKKIIEKQTLFLQKNKSSSATIDINEIRNKNCLHVYETTKIKSNTGGMARLISEGNVCDLFFIEEKDGFYYCPIEEKEIAYNSSITFFWRTSPNTQEWEGKDYKIYK